MSDATDPLSFADLQRAAERFGPRYDVKYRSCPSCGLGGTQPAVLVTPGQDDNSPRHSVTWMLCGFCGTAWPAGEDLFDVPPAPRDVEESVYAFFFNEIAVAEVFQPFKGASMFRKKTAPGGDPNADLAAALFDPWHGVPPSRKNDPDDVSTPPAGWDRLHPDSRARVGLTLLEADPPGVQAGPWRRLRARHLRGGDGGDGQAMSDVLLPYFISDPIERRKWLKAEVEVGDQGPYLLVHALRKLRASGDLLTTLRARREELDAQIVRLERRLGLASTETAGAADAS